ncbi:hypothetical Protein YC6258_00294 [Gynuella sunshinyii YC6258]|uniref:Uncharacterized protein n=1 Tax=Gynuella sunshinyii YC6258 TaxID=1445510 RepID=A0A0C5VQ00_9GAMM|nr:hypothetical Protein YC6258_00294 [Gynuella sunshinyii YC6258]
MVVFFYVQAVTTRNAMIESQNQTGCDGYHFQLSMVFGIR